MLFKSVVQPPWPTLSWALREARIYAAVAISCGVLALVISLASLGINRLGLPNVLSYVSVIVILFVAFLKTKILKIPYAFGNIFSLNAAALDYNIALNNLLRLFEKSKTEFDTSRIELQSFTSHVSDEMGSIKSQLNVLVRQVDLLRNEFAKSTEQGSNYVTLAFSDRTLQSPYYIYGVPKVLYGKSLFSAFGSGKSVSATDIREDVFWTSPAGVPKKNIVSLNFGLESIVLLDLNKNADTEVLKAMMGIPPSEVRRFLEAYRVYRASGIHFDSFIEVVRRMLGETPSIMTPSQDY